MNIKRASYIVLTIAVVLTGGFAAAIIFGASPPPPPLALYSAARQILVASLSDQPPIERYTARDGTALAFRRYAGKQGGGTGVLVHGSSGSSNATHILGKALAAAGINVVAIDLRGHGQSGPHGDISYDGQLDDDMMDLVRVLDQQYPGERRLLIGHSSGGGFTLRIAGGPNACAFDGFVALSPFLNYRSATQRPKTGGWAEPFIPRIIALSILNGFGIHRLDSLPAIAFAVPPEKAQAQTVTYSWRLLRNFGLDMQNWESAVKHIHQPTQVLVGGKDELFYAEKFQPIFTALQPAIGVRLLEGVNHMGIVLDERVISDVVTMAQEILVASAGATSNCRAISNPIAGS